jgi:hypothetical protein
MGVQIRSPAGQDLHRAPVAKDQNSSHKYVSKDSAGIPEKRDARRPASSSTNLLTPRPEKCARDRWFERDKTEYYIRESCFRTGANSVLVLLWSEDEQQLIELDGLFSCSKCRKYVSVERYVSHEGKVFCSCGSAHLESKQ